MKKLTALLVVFISLVFVLPGVVYAQQNIASGDNVVLSKDQIINQDYFASGNSVTISGTVNGDVYIAGGNVLVDGIINGDLLTVGGTVNVVGSVSGNIRAVGGNITISGLSDGNTSLVGGSLNITNNADIGGSLVAVGGEVQVFAPVGKGATVAGGQVTLGNVVGGNVTSGASMLTLTSSANVAGNLDYWSQNQPQIQPGASVAGQTSGHMVAVSQEPVTKFFGALVGISLFLKLIGFISQLIIGLLILRFFPNFSQGVVETIKGNPWWSLGVGFLALILTPIIVIILLVTVIGIPLALLLLVAYIIVLCFARIFIALLIGQWILKQKGNITWAFALGLIIFVIISLIPFIGGLFSFFATLFAVGAYLITKRDFYQKLKSTI